MGDLKEGFNQVDNEEDTKKKMAVLSAGGCWLPRGLTFGPTNGPEDFQELVFTVFQRRLYKDWFLFVDDLSVATGRPKCHAEGPSEAHDVANVVRDDTVGEKADEGLGVKSGSACKSPYAHDLGIWLLLKWILFPALFWAQRLGRACMTGSRRARWPRDWSNLRLERGLRAQSGSPLKAEEECGLGETMNLSLIHI